jgi:hypothetical protein
VIVGFADQYTFADLSDKAKPIRAADGLRTSYLALVCATPEVESEVRFERDVLSESRTGPGAPMRASQYASPAGAGGSRAPTIRVTRSTSWAVDPRVGQSV